MSDEMERAEKRLILAALAPITLADAALVMGLAGDPLSDGSKRLEVFRLLAQMRLEYADALLSQAGL